MRTASATYPTMVPQIAQQWQADAGAGGAAGGEAPATAEGVGTVAQAETTEASFDDAFSALTAPDDPSKKKPDPAPATAAQAPETGGGLPEVGADGKPVAVVEETAEAKAAREATASGQETPEQKAAREAAAAPVPPAPAPAAAPAANDSDAIMKALRGIIEGKETAPQQAQEEPTYTAEQQAIVDNFTKEWPEIAQAQELIRAAEYKQLTRFMFTQIAPVLAQMQQQMGGVAAVTHEQQLHQLVPDYADIRQPVVDWIAKQPAILKPTLEAVATNGTAQQVAEMIGMWRTATNTPVPTRAAPVAPAPAPAPAPRPAPASAAALAALTPVKGARSTPPAGGIDPGDFDAAFVEAAKSMAATSAM